MKKAFLFLMCLTIILTMAGCSGCKNSSKKKVDNTTDTKNDNIAGMKKIENTTTIIIGYDINSYTALIDEQEEIKRLEDLFNEVEFEKSETSIQQPWLTIIFHGEKSSTSFYIDDKDVISRDPLGEDNLKSEQISFKNLYSIYKENLLSEKK